MKSKSLCEPNDVASSVINFIHDQLQIDAEWSESRPRGFCWWGHRVKQTVWSDEPLQDRGLVVTRVHARTDVLKKVSLDRKAIKTLAFRNTDASLSSLQYDPVEQTISLYCSAWVHAGNVHWVQPLLTHAVALQAAWGSVIANGRMSGSFGGQINASKPAHGRARQNKDNMLDIIAQVYFPMGLIPPSVTGADYAQALALVKKLRWIGTASETGFTCEVPPTKQVAATCERTALIQVSSAESHPLLGNGVFFRLTLPEKLDEALAPRMAIELNRAEITDETGCHHLGAWGVGPAGLAWVTFLPNAAHGSGLVAALVQSLAIRANWARQRLTSLLPESHQ